MGPPKSPLAYVKTASFVSTPSPEKLTLQPKKEAATEEQLDIKVEEPADSEITDEELIAAAEQAEKAT